MIDKSKKSKEERRWKRVMRRQYERNRRKKDRRHERYNERAKCKKIVNVEDNMKDIQEKDRQNGITKSRTRPKIWKTQWNNKKNKREMVEWKKLYETPGPCEYDGLVTWIETLYEGIVERIK